MTRRLLFSRAACAFAVTACAAGPIGQNTPASSGQGFVGGSDSTTYFRPGSRPAVPAVSGTTLDGQRLSLMAERGSVLGIDVRDTVPAAQAFDANFGVSYPSLRDPGEQIALAFHATVPPAAIPTTLVIDQTGHIAARVIGMVTYDGLRALIARIMAGKA